MKGLLFALKGLIEAFTSQLNMKIHLFITVAVVASGFLLKIENTEWMMIIFCIGFVFATELINTAIEYLVDFISPDFHQKAGKIKDIAAAGVLISALTSIIVGLVIFLPRIIFLIKYF